MKEIQESSKNLSLIYRYVYEIISSELKSIDLTPGLSILLIGIMRNEGLNQKSIGKIIHVDKSTVSRNIRALEEREYIKKRIDPDNRRNFIITITEKGKMKAEESLEIQYRLWDKIFLNISKGELEKLNDVLEKMNDNILHMI